MTSSTLISSVVCTRYAGALVDLAEGSKSVQKVQKDFVGLEEVISESSEFTHLIASPLVSKEKQAAIIIEIGKKLKLNKLTQNFLGVLVENRRLSALSQIIKTYNKIVAERSGEVEVRVETAVKLTATQLKDLKAQIEKSLGHSVSVETEVKPEILGGMIVTIGSYMVDDSVRRKLERLGVALKSNSSENTNLKEVV